MTMIIDKNAKTYSDYVFLKRHMKALSKSKKDIEYVNSIIDGYLLTKDNINNLTTIEGIDTQIEKFSSNVGFVFYVDIINKDDLKQRRAVVKKIVLVAKEVEDD